MRIGCKYPGQAWPALSIKQFLAIASAAWTGFVAVSSIGAATTTRPADRPNVIVICAGGLSAGTTGFDGNTLVKTPNLDKLAAESVRFSRAYSTSPQAASSRASILTGQYPHVNGATGDAVSISSRSVSFAEAFTRAGYECGLVGSWKLPPLPEPEKTPGGPSANPPGAPAPGSQPGGTSSPVHPFPPGSPSPGIGSHPRMPGTTIIPAATQSSSVSRTVSGPAPGLSTRPSATLPAASMPAIPVASMPAAAPVPPPLPKLPKPGLGFDSFYATSDPGGPMENAKVCVNGDQKTTDRYLPDWHTDQAIEFIRKSGGKPFCLCLFYPQPREPLSYPPAMQNLYPPASLPPISSKPMDPKNLPGRLSSCEAVMNFRNKQTGDQLRQSQSKYYATVTRMDENIGRLLRVLSELNLDRNTIVVFTSDQGFATGENGVWGAGPMFWDKFIRCPLLVRLPRASSATLGPALASAPTAALVSTRGKKVGQMISFVDIAPTLLEAAGLMVQPVMQGRSLLGLMRDGVDPERLNECFAEMDTFNGQQFQGRALIADAYKLVDYTPETDQFYNLKRDPDEEQNLADERTYSSVVKVMRARLDRWRKRTHDPLMR